MKPIFILVLCLIPGIIRAQGISEKEVPVQVKKAFEKKFPQVETYNWYTEDAAYIVEFVKEDLDYLASFNHKGNWEYTQNPVDEESLPAVILDTVNENFSSPTILEAHFKEIRNGESIYILTVQDDTMDEGGDDDGVYESNTYLFEILVSDNGQVIAKNSI